jgi:hypothetical protein
MTHSNRPRRNQPVGLKGKGVSYARRALAPTIEVIEGRLLMTGGAGFLTGSVLLDGTSGTPVPGVTVELFKASNTSSPLATRTTDANGQYLFTGLAPGDYLLKDVAPSGYQATGSQVNSQLDPASSLANDTIKVTVVDPTKVYVNYGGVNPYEVVNVAINGGAAKENSVGTFNDTLGTSPGATDLNSGFLTYCVNDLQSLSFSGGEQYRVNPEPVTSLSNGHGTISADHAGRIAYLFNHFGTSSLTNVQAAGLQLAIWELLYDQGNTPDFTSGNFQVPGGVSPYTDSSTFAQVISQATSYYNASAGKSETAVFLDAAPANPCQTQGLQGVLCTGSLDFSVKPAPLTCLTRGETATIGFWHNKNGQALINGFNGGPTSTALANWLATSFPNLYGPGKTGTNPNDLTGKTNADVAALFLKFFDVKGVKADAQVLAVALADYATTASLGGSAAKAYGFTVTAGGVGTAAFNVGSAGAAFGVPNGTVLSVAQILSYADSKSKNGLLYNGDTSLIVLANSVFDGINQGGDIG